MKKIRLCLLLLVTIVSSICLHAEEGNIPAALQTAILANYPLDLLCAQESERQNGEEIPPPEQHFSRGWIHVFLNEASSSDARVAVVTYAWPAPGDLPDADVLTFREDGEQWRRVDPIGQPGAVLNAGSDGQDISFQDIDGDGVPEIVLLQQYVAARGPNATKDVAVWKLTEAGLKALTPGHEEWASLASWKAELTESPFPGGKPPECEQILTTVYNRSDWSSNTSIWLKDLDDDGKLELILGPDQARLPDPDPTCTPNTCGPFLQDVTGTRILSLVDGVYQLVGETPVGVGLRPTMAAAMAPASMPQEMMLAHLDSGTEDTKEKESRINEPSAVSEVPLRQAKNKRADRFDAQAAKITLFISPPQGYSLEEVDWSTLKVAGGALTPREDEGTHIAPNTAEFPEAWIPWSQSGQLMYLEDLKESDPGNFSCGDEDPVVFLAPGGRMHFGSAYRILRFDSSQVLTWLATQWRAGRMDQDGKSCFTVNERDWCYTPIGLPFEVRLTTSIGPYPITAHGVASLWVRN